MREPEENAQDTARIVEKVIRDALALAWEQGWQARSAAESAHSVIPANPYGLGYREGWGDA